jgi:hypothetical protein
MSSRLLVSLSIGLPPMAILDQQYLISSSTYLIAQFLASGLGILLLLIYTIEHQKDIQAATLLLAFQNVCTNTEYRIK